MIFHICPPDILFVRNCLDEFEKVKSGINRCVIIVSKRHLDPRHNIDNKLIEYFGPLNAAIIRRINESGCSGVIVHTLNDDILELALNLKSSIPLLWKSWGPDLHDIIYPDFRPLLPHTKRLVGNRNIVFEKTISKIRSVRDHLLKGTSVNSKRVRKKMEFLNRLSFIATVTSGEYKMLIDRAPELKAEKFHLNYGTFELKKKHDSKVNFDQMAVMVGHSSFPYHNHADIFFQLSEFPDFTSRILVPLSYGNTNYRDKVIALGNKLFNPGPEYLTDILPLDDYLEKIGRCHTFILNSRVQSGGANIIYSLLQGLKVYLRNENPTYKDFIDAGIILFSIQDDLSKDHLTRYQLTESAIKGNRQILGSLFNYKKEAENIRDIYYKLSVPVK